MLLIIATLLYATLIARLVLRRFGGSGSAPNAYGDVSPEELAAKRKYSQGQARRRWLRGEASRRGTGETAQQILNRVDW